MVYTFNRGMFVVRAIFHYAGGYYFYSSPNSKKCILCTTNCLKKSDLQ